MSEGMNALSRMAYPGRLIILGKSPDEQGLVVIYAITGRSAASQARRIVFQQTTALVKATDESRLQSGDPELLLYPAIMMGRRVAVSNGRQTPSIQAFYDDVRGPAEILAEAMNDWDYEPDAPNFTPRISGCIAGQDRAALSILRRGRGGDCLKNFFEFPLRAGAGKMICTYSGQNVNPLPAFSGEPLDIKLGGVTARRVAEAAYAALGPPEGEDDFRVAVACVFIRDLEHEVFEHCVLNRHDRSEQDG